MILYKDKDDKFEDLLNGYRLIKNISDLDNKKLILEYENEKFIAGLAYEKKSSELFELSYLLVSPNFHGQNYGTKLVKELEKIAKENNIKEIRVTKAITKKALRFYLNLGYNLLDKKNKITHKFIQ